VAIYIKSTCDECQPTLSCSTPCCFFSAEYYQSYLDDNESLPDEIYLGGTRQIITRTLIPDWPDPPPRTGTFWGGVSGGTLLSRSGTSYGNTTKGVILEPVDPEDLEAGYVWAVYREGARSTAQCLIDGINRHDNLPSSYQMIVSCTGSPLVNSPEYFSAVYGGPRTEMIYRSGCTTYDMLVYYAGSACPVCGDPTIPCSEVGNAHPNFVWPAGVGPTDFGYAGLYNIRIDGGNYYSTMVGIRLVKSDPSENEEYCFVEGVAADTGNIIKNENGKWPNMVGDYSLGGYPDGEPLWTCLTIS
jgi:hypothetical protein